MGKSFKSNDSYKSLRKEEHSVPLDQQESNAGHSSIDRSPEITVKIDGIDDPPSKLISKFLQKQKETGQMALDMDLEMDEWTQDNQQQIQSKEIRVSFQPSSNPYNGNSTEHVRKYNDEEEWRRNVTEAKRNDGEILKCTSNSSFQKSSVLLRNRTKSRLIDPTPGEEDQRSTKVLKSGQQGKVIDEEDDDSFLDEDIPYKFEEKMGIMTVLQWVSLVVLVAGFICSLTLPCLVNRRLWGLHLWKWELLILVLICGRLVSGWGIRLVVFFIEKNFLLRRKVLYFVYCIRKAVQNCLWLGLVLVAWHDLFDKKVERETNNKILHLVTKILVYLLVSTLIWVVKTLLVKVLASSFHVSTYFDRIQEALFHQHIIETLSGPPLIEIKRTQEEEQNVINEMNKIQNAGVKIPPELKASGLPIRSGRINTSGIFQGSTQIGKNGKISGTVASKDVSRQQQEGITIDHLHKLNQKNISAWNMKRLITIVRHGVLSTTIDERILDSTHGDESSMLIRSELEAKIAARKIFNNVAKPCSRHIYLHDLLRFMEEDEAQKTMSFFEGSNEGKRITKSALKNWVVNVFRERRALSLTLNDTKTAVNKLHQMVNVAVSVILVILWFLILGIATSHLLVLISSQLLLVAFIFGNTCKMIFEAIIFLFVMHPFDVGDRCEIDGVQLIVEEMNILTTVFLRHDNQKIAYPNSVLSTKPIGNYYRSPDMGDSIEFSVHVATSVEKIALMKEKIQTIIENNKERFHPNPTFLVKDVVDMNELKMAVSFLHRMNHQDMKERWLRRGYVVEEMIKVFRELDIEYRMLPLDINLQNTSALTSPGPPPTW